MAVEGPWLFHWEVGAVEDRAQRAGGGGLGGVGDGLRVAVVEDCGDPSGGAAFHGVDDFVVGHLAHGGPVLLYFLLHPIRGGNAEFASAWAVGGAVDGDGDRDMRYGNRLLSAYYLKEGRKM